jgi:formylglycine-generating enzyme required for sulfatase activity
MSLYKLVSDVFGIPVTLTHDDMTTEDVTAANFTAKNVTATPANGIILDYSMHNGRPVKITYGNLTKDTNNLTVGKATPTASDFNISGTGTFIYNGNSMTVTITPKEGKTTGSITVKYNGSTTVPLAASTYTVTFDVAGTTNFNAASGLSAGTLTIEKATPIAADFNVSGTGTFIYNGNPKIVTITPEAGKSNGTITVKYNGNTTAPSAAGTYTVTFDVVETTNFNAANGLSAGTLKIIVIEMVSIPAGTFIMGSPRTEPNSNNDETQHSVTLTKSFYMGKYQVTQAQYQAVMGAGEDRTTTGNGKGDDYPIYYVNWYDAIVFCNKLSILEGLNPVYSIGGSTDPSVWGAIPTGNNATWNAAVMDTSKNGYRLPTETEWEYACRGSYTNKATETATKPFGIGDGTQMINGMANFNVTYSYDSTRYGEYDSWGTSLQKTTTVGSYAANNYGLFDMHGNLYEWCWDWYDSSYYSSSHASDPTGPGTGSNRVGRGGGWDSSGRKLRSAYRYYSNPNDRYYLIGFRLVRF